MMETIRLYLRRVRKEDAASILNFINSDFVLKYNCYRPYNEARLIHLIENGMDFVLIHKQEQRIIGMIGIEEDKVRFNPKVVSLTYLLDENYTRQGYMKEALKEIIYEIFETLGKDRVSLRIFEENMASRKLAESLGFQLEGVLKDAVLRYDGTVFNDCLYSISKEEFFKSTM